jgi:hypothetical protein
VDSPLHGKGIDTYSTIRALFNILYIHGHGPQSALKLISCQKFEARCANRKCDCEASQMDFEGVSRILDEPELKISLCDHQQLMPKTKHVDDTYDHAYTLRALWDCALLRPKSGTRLPCCKLANIRSCSAATSRLLK